MLPAMQISPALLLLRLIKAKERRLSDPRDINALEQCQVDTLRPSGLAPSFPGVFF